jgi:hypothetical protein
MGYTHNMPTHNMPNRLFLFHRNSTPLHGKFVLLNQIEFLMSEFYIFSHGALYTEIYANLKIQNNGQKYRANVPILGYGRGGILAGNPACDDNDIFRDFF